MFLTVSLPSMGRSLHFEVRRRRNIRKMLVSWFLFVFPTGVFLLSEFGTVDLLQDNRLFPGPVKSRQVDHLYSKLLPLPCRDFTGAGNRTVEDRAGLFPVEQLAFPENSIMHQNNRSTPTNLENCLKWSFIHFVKQFLLKKRFTRNWVL